ncbi:MAG: hypothetical protein KDK70_20955 [Myxococcales bacterium]|nr:hypothetical protein [Myxococcales bacterium]
MEAHLDALVLGGALALDVVQLEARPDEPGTFYAWVALACRVGRLDMIRDALVALEWFCDVAVDDAEPSALRRTVADALSHMGDDRRNAIAAELPQLQEARIQLAGPPSARHDRHDPHHSVGASNDG